MFRTENQELQKLAKEHPEAIKQLENLFQGRVNVYIDYANVRPWADKLGWHVDMKRLKNFYRAFDNVRDLKVYYGTLKGNPDSEKNIAEWKKFGYTVRTKDVKIIRLPINASSISPQSTDILRNFVRPPLLRKWDVETIEHLNRKFAEMNKRGINYLEDRKCNFDVEIGRDMTLDRERDGADCFVLWSGDSDFHDPLNEILSSGKKALLFATARTVSTELSELRSKGLFIFDIKKIKEMICWRKEIGL